MSDEDAFLAGLAAQPADDTTRLVYADWLEEQGTDEANRKAEFLRLTCQPPIPEQRRGEKEAVRARLQALAGGLEPDWLAVVSRLKVEQCVGKRKAALRGEIPLSMAFEFVCDRLWDEMTATGDRTVRYC